MSQPGSLHRPPRPPYFKSSNLKREAHVKLIEIEQKNYSYLYQKNKKSAQTVRRHRYIQRRRTFGPSRLCAAAHAHIGRRMREEGRTARHEEKGRMLDHHGATEGEGPETGEGARWSTGESGGGREATKHTPAARADRRRQARSEAAPPQTAGSDLGGAALPRPHATRMCRTPRTSPLHDVHWHEYLKAD